MHELVEQLLSYLKATWRYRWYGAGVAWVVAMAGWAAVAQLPDRYQASARVYVDTQSILRPLLAGLALQPNINQVVEMMSKTLISRPNVEKVVDMANINVKNADDREDTVTRLSKELTIKGTGAQNFYTIAFADKDPQQAKRVVQSLLTIFVEGSVGDKRKDSDLARNFIDDQLKVYTERLMAAENAVTEFKRRNLGLMPGQGQNFYSRLGEARTALSQAKLELAEAEQGRDAIKRRFTEEAPPSLLDERVAPEGATPETATPEFDARIQALQQKLDNLRLTYTEQHPDIVAILPIIDQLREQKQRERDQKLREAKSRKTAPVAVQTKDAVSQQLIISMTEYEASVASLKARVAEYERRLNELKAATNAIPQVEAEFIQLTRDYEVTKKNYEQLMTRRESAQLTGDMQSTPNIMDFRVIDPPQVPSTAEWPNRPLFISVVFLASLAAGICFAFLISQLRPTINSERRLLEIGGLPVFGSVMMAWTEPQKKREKNGRIALIVCMLSLLSAYAVMLTAPTLQRISNFGAFFRLP